MCSNGAWSAADVVVDVVGYYSKDSESSFLPLVPERVFDTRDPQEPGLRGTVGRQLLSTGAVISDDGRQRHGLRAERHGHQHRRATGTSRSPRTRTRWTTYINETALLAGPPPNSSNLNWTKGDTVPNLVQASTGNHGIIDFWNQQLGRHRPRRRPLRPVPEGLVPARAPARERGRR
ncbi:hypothetical protein [Streptomyces avidinii]